MDEAAQEENMQIRTLQKENWQAFFDLVSKMVQGQRVELEIAGIDTGDQVEAEWSFVDGLSYEEDSGMLFIHTDVLDHMIQNPLEIVVIEKGASIEMIGIKDDGDQIQIVKFRAPLLLEARKTEFLNQ